MSDWAIRGEQACLDASEALCEYLDIFNKNYSLVKIGGHKPSTAVNGIKTMAKVDGFIKVEKIDYKNIKYILNKTEIDIMRDRKLSLTKKADIDIFIKSLDIEDDVLWVPHSWVFLYENGREILLDPSGFFPNLKGQFDTLVSSTSNAEYRVFNGRE